MWRLAIYSLPSAWYEKFEKNVTSERPPNILVESLKLNSLNKEVVFSRRWVDILLTIFNSYSVIKFEWSLLTGGLCSEMVITKG